MRTYAVTTNTEIVLELPALTVTVRTAFWNPPEVLHETGGGRECWVGGKAARAYFQISPIVGDKAAVLSDVEDLDGDPIFADARPKPRRTGIAVTHVITQWKKHTGKPKVVAEARIPLWGLASGDYLLAIVPSDHARTKPDEPSGPKTTIEPMDAWDERQWRKHRRPQMTYRPLYVRITLDEDLRLKKAVTVLWDKADGSITDRETITHPTTKKPSGYTINHGYVTATAFDQLAIDWKPDFLRTPRTKDQSRAATESGVFKQDRQLVVVHGTDGGIISGGLGEVLKSIPRGPQYEIDRDGHTLKFAYDDDDTAHPGKSTYYDPWVGHISPKNSIGIENLNYSSKHGKPQRSYSWAQTLALKALLEKLKSAHPSIARHRIVGHCDIRLQTDSNNNIIPPLKLGNNKRTCPGREMQWPWLERFDLGRPCSKRPLTRDDYRGFFAIRPNDLVPPPKTTTPLGTAIGKRLDRIFRPINRWLHIGELFLQPGDNDKEHKWGGKNWRKGRHAEVMKAKGLEFHGIITELQKDLQTLGYIANRGGKFNGVFDEVTVGALLGFLWRTFTGDRIRYIGRFDPKPHVTLVVAEWLKGSIDALLLDKPGVPTATGVTGPADEGNENEDDGDDDAHGGDGDGDGEEDDLTDEEIELMLDMDVDDDDADEP